MSARTVLVTGGNRGIGLAACRGLARAGLRVVLTARRLEDAVAGCRELQRDGLDIVAEELDLASERSVQACAARLEKSGRPVDVLVNNGAVLFDGDVLSTPSEQFRAAVDVNLLGALWCCRAFVPGMVARKYGRVVNVSSGWGSFAEGLDGPASYSITKAALNALTVSLAHDERRREGQCVLARVGAHADGRRRRRPLARGGRGGDRVARHAAARRTGRRVLPGSRVDRLVKRARSGVIAP